MGGNVFYFLTKNFFFFFFFLFSFLFFETNQKFLIRKGQRVETSEESLLGLEKRQEEGRRIFATLDVNMLEAGGEDGFPLRL